MAALWASGRALSPGEVNEALGDRYAYTTVMTVMSRLWTKGLLDRRPQGRGYVYEPVMSENEMATRKMADTLSSAKDPAGVLAGFVGSLSTRDVKHLRRLLGEAKGPPK